MRPCIFIIGTRAQLVKLAPVLRIAVETGLSHVVWFSGQHRESINDLISDFNLKSTFVLPDNHKERSSITSLIAWLPKMLLESRRYLLEQSRIADTAPLVIVHGDTLTTFLAALAAKTSTGDVIHLESGLTSKSVLDPFPEEALRRLTFHLTRYAFCPNHEATAFMRRFKKCEVVDTQENTLIDSVRYALEANTQNISRIEGNYFVASIHRFQNIYHSSRLKRLISVIEKVSRHGTVYFVLHPSTERRLTETGQIKELREIKSIRLIPRLPYTEFLRLIAYARGVLTDGGSNQEELSYLGIPTILFRTRTERPDGLEKNIKFAHDIPKPLDQFIAEGGLDAMRETARTDIGIFPSSQIVNQIKSWAATA